MSWTEKSPINWKRCSSTAVVITVLILQPNLVWLRDRQASVVRRTFNVTINLKCEEVAEALKGIGTPKDCYKKCWRSVRAMVIENAKIFEKSIFFILKAEGRDGIKDWIEEGRRSTPDPLALRRIYCNEAELVW